MRFRPEVSDSFRLRVNVDVFGFDNRQVPSLQAYYDLLARKELHKFILYSDHGHNLVTNTGLNQVGNLICGVNTTSYTYCGVGSGTNAAAAGDTDLQTVISPRQVITNRYVSSSVAHLDTFFASADNAGTWAETIIGTAVSGANAGARRVLASTFTKDTTKSAVIAWTLTLTAV